MKPTFGVPFKGCSLSAPFFVRGFAELLKLLHKMSEPASFVARN
jgi:hypothetical protein